MFKGNLLCKSFTNNGYPTNEFSQGQCRGVLYFSKLLSLTPCTDINSYFSLMVVFGLLSASSQIFKWGKKLEKNQGYFRDDRHPIVHLSKKNYLRLFLLGEKISQSSNLKQINFLMNFKKTRVQHHSSRCTLYPALLWHGMIFFPTIDKRRKGGENSLSLKKIVLITRTLQQFFSSTNVRSLYHNPFPAYFEWVRIAPRGNLTVFN